MTERKRILFVAWDAPHVNYLEGLFTPIFERVAAFGEFEFHVLHFSWCSKSRSDALQEMCRTKGIKYRHIPVFVFPPIVGKLISLWIGSRELSKYIVSNRIDIVMPRSTMPARMFLSSKIDKKVKVVFDADGLPIEERVDFANLSFGGFRYRALKRIEKKILNRADAVLTRSFAAIDYLTNQHEINYVEKFHRVINGRDEKVFDTISGRERKAVRAKLGIPDNAFLMVYTGSLGPQYGIEEMFEIQNELLKRGVNSWLLVIALNPEYLENLFCLPRNTLVRKAAFKEVPSFLAAGDVGLAIREPAPSMKGVAPVKLGEYLLCGLPVIASSGIGDSEEILRPFPFAFVLKNHSKEWIEKAVDYAERIARGLEFETNEIRKAGMDSFGLVKSACSYRELLLSLTE